MILTVVLLYAFQLCLLCPGFNVNCSAPGGSDILNPIAMAQKIELNHTGKQLLQEVERLYGKHVQIELIKSDDPYYGGQSDVLDDGTPRVRVNLRSSQPATTLVHELFHLRLRHNGIPTLYIPASPQHIRLDEDTLSYVQYLFTEVRDLVTHSLFFREMRHMGYDPSVNMRSFFTRSLESGDLDNIKDPVNRTTNLVKVLLEANSTTLVERFENLFRRRGWTQEVTLANELAQFVRDRQPRTPEEVVDVFLGVVNRLMQGRGTFSLAQWNRNMKGSGFVERSVVILISEPR